MNLYESRKMFARAPGRSREATIAMCAYFVVMKTASEKVTTAKARTSKVNMSMTPFSVIAMVMPRVCVRKMSFPGSVNMYRIESEATKKRGSEYQPSKVLSGSLPAM